MNVFDLSKDKFELYSRIYFYTRCDSFCPVHKDEYFYYLKVLEELDPIENEEYNLCVKFLKNRYKKKSRYYRCIDYMLNNYPVCYFCTFTFNDDGLALDKLYTRKVLTQMLKSLHTCYLGNVDFGEKKGRLHYHVIIAENDVHISKDNVKWGFGYYDIKPIYNKDSVRLGSYIMKLVNHCTKESVKDNIITPRGEFSFTKLLKNYSINA